MGMKKTPDIAITRFEFGRGVIDSDNSNAGFFGRMNDLPISICLAANYLHARLEVLQHLYICTR